MACAGCSTSAPVENAAVSRRLPEKPGFLKRVDVREPRAEDDTEVVAGRERAGRAKANDIIACGADWIDRRNEAYAAGRIEPDPSKLKACRTLEEMPAPRRTP